MAAVLGYIVGREYIEPRIGELAVTSDGGVIARLAGEATFTHFVCDYDELIMTWVNVLVAARLTEAEKLHAASLFAEKIGFCGQSQA